MQLNEIDFGAARPIEGYGPGFFRLGGEALPAPVIIAPGQTTPWQGYDDPAPLLAGVAGEEGPRLTGNEIDTERPITGGFNAQTGQMEINFAFKTDGANSGSQTWANLTSQYLQQQIAITLDSQVISAPVIQSATPFGSATSITGQFTQEEAQELANNLRYGALPLSFAGEDGEPGGTAQSVPASLGAASLQAGLIAGGVGMLLVAVFVFAYYRLFGFISLITLFTAGLLVYGTLILLGRWIGYSLDLSGVAGLIIGIGTTADSFVVFYERVKDEVRDGRTFRSAAQHGWDRAKRTIVTGNMVTLIGAVVIYLLAVGEVKGFAFTLGLTTVFDLLVTFLVTAPLMLLAARKPFFAKPAVNGMGKVFELAESKRAAKTSRTEARETRDGAEAGEHLLGVVARHHRLDHRGHARRVQGGEQHGRLDLRRGHRHAVFDGCGTLRPAERQRHAVAGGGVEHLHAHQPQRIEHAAHRPLRQRGVADEGRPHVVGADEAHGQARAGAGIAEIERGDRLQQAAVADAADDPFVAALLDLRAHRLHGVAGAQHVLALEQAGDTGLARRQPAEHEGAVRDRLVARQTDAAGKRLRARGGGGGRLGGRMGGGVHRASLGGAPCAGAVCVVRGSPNMAVRRGHPPGGSAAAPGFRRHGRALRHRL